MTSETVREAVRRSIADELRPVKPLPQVWQRWLVVVVIATLVCAGTLAMLPVRSDLAQLPLWLSWGCSALELIMGLLLVSMALREAIPGSAVPRGTALAFVAGGGALQIVVGVATWVHSRGIDVGDDTFARGIGCFTHDSVMALPVFIVTLWLIFRALPMRAPMAGLLGGAGAAIGADAITHLLCPFSALDHILVWHTGVIVLFMIAGWAVGKVWDRVRWRRAG